MDDIPAAPRLASVSELALSVNAPTDGPSIILWLCARFHFLELQLADIVEYKRQATAGLDALAAAHGASGNCCMSGLAPLCSFFARSLFRDLADYLVRVLPR